MDQGLIDVFEQARKIVADADRKIAEEEERRREIEREGLLLQLAARIEDSFDFTSKEKLELEPRLDVQDGIGVIEFVVRSLRAIFVLLPTENNLWQLLVIEDGCKATDAQRVSRRSEIGTSIPSSVGSPSCSGDR
jgi:hypothetical protein